jgi:STE24 endopeptidase
VSRSPGILTRALRLLGPVALAAASAELAARALAPREPVAAPEPVDILDHFTEGQIRRGRRYARPQLALGLVRSTLDAGVLVALVRAQSRRPRLGDPRPRAAATRVTVLRDGGLAAGLSVALSVPGLPVAALARRRARSVGLVTQSWRGWATDLGRASAIQGALAAVGGAGILGIMRRWPRQWWLPAAGGSVAVGAAAAGLAPVLLDPVFNRFTPLPDGPLRSDVLGLAAAAGVRVGGVYSVDASRRTTAANAYVSGLGPSKRIVLFDTLIDRYSPEEIRVVVAHELAHVRHRDVLRGVAFAAACAPGAAFAVQRLTTSLSDEPTERTALPALALSLGIVSVPIGVISGRLSRALERRADAYSLALSRAPEAFISFERTIALQNVADLDPPRLVQALSTHPPTGERIGAALAYRGASS